MEVGKYYIFKHIIGGEYSTTEERYLHGDWMAKDKIYMSVTHNGNRNGTGTVQSAEIKTDPPITVKLDAIIIGKKPPEFIEINVKSNGLVIGSLPIDYFKGNNSADIWKYENAALGRSQSQSKSQSKSQGRIQSGGRIASPKSVKYSPTSRTILKTINGVSRERKVWLNKEKKEFVRVTVNGKLVFKKV